MADWTYLGTNYRYKPRIVNNGTMEHPAPRRMFILWEQRGDNWEYLGRFLTLSALRESVRHREKSEQGKRKTA